ncbi:UDP-2,3-diacylglucosamine diphosphatase [Tundrisphaera sp. TA3]|uniref:UDP-2,3-diacylglucosamine diphosphatase n=1 Tax=Tundrisphaera sp. TA3 TaxID=3435775 RepID=UPI003EB99A64
MAATFASTPAEIAPPSPYDCLIISDIHLGSEMVQGRLLECFLNWAVANSRELVINGDIFDDLNFKRLKKRHFACLKIIRKNSDRPDFRLTWIRGNHDGPADIIGHIVGVNILDERIYEDGRIRLLILHGDQFDRIITHNPWLTEIACGLFYWIQRWFPHRAARWIRRTTKKWQRNGPQVQDGAIEYARSLGCQAVTCGHTHSPLVAEKDGILYVNSGTWIESSPCPFVSVKDGEVLLRTWPPAGVPLPAGREDADEEEPGPPRKRIEDPELRPSGASFQGFTRAGASPDA